MNISLSAFAPENLVSRDGFGSPVPRQPAHLHTQAEYAASINRSVREGKCSLTAQRTRMIISPPPSPQVVRIIWGRDFRFVRGSRSRQQMSLQKLSNNKKEELKPGETLGKYRKHNTSTCMVMWRKYERRSEARGSILCCHFIHVLCNILSTS